MEREGVDVVRLDTAAGQVAVLTPAGDTAVLAARLGNDPATWLPAPATPDGPDAWTVALYAGPVSRNVRCTVGPLAQAGDEAWRAVEWDPSAAGGPVGALLPVFRGQLGVVAVADHATLFLTGDYEPPAGPLGRQLDAKGLRRVAESTARRFLDAVVAARLAATDGPNGAAARRGVSLLAMDPLDLLADAASAMAGALETDAVLQTVVDVAARTTGARYAALGVLGDDGTITRFVTHGASDDVIRAIGHYPTGRGLLGLLILQPRIVRVADLRDHPAAAGFPPHHPPITAFLGGPVRSGGRVFGNLYLTDRAVGFTEEDERLLAVLAAQAGAAVENAKLSARLRQLAVSAERERISRELHDSVIQTLYSVGMGLQAARADRDRPGHRRRTHRRGRRRARPDHPRPAHRDLPPPPRGRRLAVPVARAGGAGARVRGQRADPAVAPGAAGPRRAGPGGSRARRARHRARGAQQRGQARHAVAAGRGGGGRRRRPRGRGRRRRRRLRAGHPTVGAASATSRSARRPSVPS